MPTQIYVQKFSVDERRKITEVCRNQGLKRSRFYHDAIVAYVSRKEEDEKKEEAK